MEKSFQGNRKEYLIQESMESKRSTQEEDNLDLSSNKETVDEEDYPFLNGKTSKKDGNLIQINSNSFEENKIVMPQGHPEANAKDKEKCPYFKMQKQGEVHKQEELQQSQQTSVLSSSSEDEEGKPKRPKGGCPFMPSDRKKNPGLEHVEETFGIHYLSRYAAYLEGDNLESINRDFSEILRKKATKKRKVFESYPIYLKHTLFHEEEAIMKTRRKDVMERFFVYDKYRERGNRLYNKRRFSDALALYERSLSCLKWLELKEENIEAEEKKLRQKAQLFSKATNILAGQSNSSLKKFSEQFSEENKTNEQTEDQKGNLTQTNNNQSKPTIRNNEEVKVQLGKDSDCRQSGVAKEKKMMTFREDNWLNGKKDKEEEEYNDKDGEEEIKQYRQNDGAAQSKIKDLIMSRQSDLAEQERLRQSVLERVRQSNQQNQDKSAKEESRNLGDNDEDEKEIYRINEAKENERDSDIKSLSVEGFDDDSDRNFSEEEKEIDIDTIKEKNKNPDETMIIMDEAEKKKMIAEEQFLRQNEKEDKEFRQKYRLYITNFTDDNVVLCDGENLTDASEIDLRQSMLVSSYLSVGLCYMMMGHFREAMVAFRDAQILYKKGSLPLLRMVQCRVADKSSTYSQICEAKQWMSEAKILKREEKIFTSGRASLVVMNIQNHEEFYAEVERKLEDRISSQREKEVEILREIFERVMELNEIETEMIERGVCPAEDEVNAIEVEERELEEELAMIIEGKYYTIIESQMFAENEEKMHKTINNLKKFYETYSLMKFYKALDFRNFENNELMLELAQEYKTDMLRQKNQLRFSKLKLEYMKETFNETEHNFHIYKWALDDYIEKKRKRECKKSSSQLPPPAKSTKERVSTLLSQIFGKSSLIQFVLVFFIFYIAILFLRSSPIINSFMPFNHK